MTTPQKPDTLDFEEIQSLAQRTKEEQDNPPLIDVRDYEECKNGIIPTAHVIPLSAFDDALAKDPETFKAEYGFSKFDKTDEVVIYCRSGRRSNLAFQQAKAQGYARVRNYPGSWNEYVAKGGVEAKFP
ncbi:hypothetical protein BG004_003668 [Podila humilis]|nr:hypothetical protein BG004_003668 [Podila humilis]